MAKSTLHGFRDFVLRGNVVDLAVAVAIGAAFTAVVNALAVDLFGSLVAALVGARDLSGVTIPLPGLDQLVVGPLLAATVNFLIVAAVLYFLVVLPTNRLLERRQAGEAAAPAAVPEDVALLREIRDLLRERSGPTGPSEVIGRPEGSPPR